MIFGLLIGVVIGLQDKQAIFTQMGKARNYADQTPALFDDGFITYTLSAEGKVGETSTRFTARYSFRAVHGEVTVSSDFNGTASTEGISWKFSDKGIAPEMKEALSLGWTRMLMWSPSKKIGWMQLPAAFQNLIHTEMKDPNGTSSSDSNINVEIPDVGVESSEFGKAVAEKNAAWVKEAKKKDDADLGGWATHIIEVPVRDGKAAGSITIPVAGYGGPLPRSWGYAPVKDAYASEGEEILHGTLMIQYSVGDMPEPPELEVTIPNYEKWMPTTDPSAKRFEGEPLKIHAELKRKDGKPLKADETATKISFYLRNTSHEPGATINFPPFGQSKEADFQFTKEENPDLTIEGKEGQEAVLKGTSLTKADAVMTPFDGGGWSDLQVVAETPNGEIFGTIKGYSDRSIKLPLRENDSHIAKAFIDKYQLKNPQDDDDFENNPNTDGTPGDGLTLYEEYRGISMSGIHVRLSAKDMDLLIGNAPLSEDVKDGIRFFILFTRIVVIYNLNFQEVGHKQAEWPDYDREINFNHDQGAHKTNQHCIILLEGDTKDGSNITYLESAGGKGPGNTRAVVMNKDFPSWAEEVKDGVVNRIEWKATSLAHELSHALGVHHHGEATDTVIQVRANKDRTALEFAQYDSEKKAPGDFALLKALKLDEAAETDVKPDNKAFDNGGTLTLAVGSQNGTNSGNDDCWMRYLTADAYWNADVLYWFPNGQVRKKFMCNSKTGTGNNAADRKPHPRFGDSIIGDCVHQICVSDHK